MDGLLRLGLIVALGATGIGCGDDDGGSKGSATASAKPEKDAEVPGRDEDAGDDADAGNSYAPLCTNVDVITGTTDTEGINATTDPADFKVSRVVIGYDCETRSLVLTHSGGRCPDGDDHELTIALDSQSINAGTLPAAPININPLRSGITIRYRRNRFISPVGEWGNCGTGDMGTLELQTVPMLAADSVLQGRYHLTLNPCDDRLNEPFNVFGSFYAVSGHSLDDACGSTQEPEPDAGT